MGCILNPLENNTYITELFFRLYISIWLLDPRYGLHFLLCQTCRVQLPEASVLHRSCDICILIAHKQSVPGAPRLGFGGDGAISSQMSSLYSQPHNAEMIHLPAAAEKSYQTPAQHSPLQPDNLWTPQTEYFISVIFHIYTHTLMTYMGLYTRFIVDF